MEISELESGRETRDFEDRMFLAVRKTEGEPDYMLGVDVLTKMGFKEFDGRGGGAKRYRGGREDIVEFIGEKVYPDTGKMYHMRIYCSPDNESHRRDLLMEVSENDEIEVIKSFGVKVNQEEYS